MPAGAAPATDPPENRRMDTITIHNTEELRAAVKAGHTPEQIIFAPETVDPEILARARDEAKAAAIAAAHDPEVLAAAAKAERERILKLQHVAGIRLDPSTIDTLRGIELQAALENGTTPEAFAMSLLETRTLSECILGPISTPITPPMPSDAVAVTAAAQAPTPSPAVPAAQPVAMRSLATGILNRMD